ncbi:MAG: competence protein ComK [Bacillus sp. (in: firmicutes)]
MNKEDAQNLDMLLVDEYEWHPDTMMIKHIYYGGRACSYVIEKERKLIVRKKTKEVINDSCMYYGTSLDGNQRGTSIVTNYQKKVPIFICESLGLLVFPTASPSKESCCWISQPHIKACRSKSPNETIVLFNNNVSETIRISYASFTSQIERAAFLQTSLKSRIAEKKLYYPTFGKDDE